MNAETQDKLVTPPAWTRSAAARRRARALSKTSDLEDADVVVVSYGITSRVAQRAIRWRATQGIKVGMFRLITVWPFPEQHDPRTGRAASRPSSCRS